jgi:release factor glutamine methyltransferase
LNDNWTVLAALRWTTGFFESRGALSPRVDSELLLADILGIERIHLYVQYDRPLSAEEREKFRGVVSRRGRGEPVQYILCEQEFWSLPFKVTQDVLIPRPETEILVDHALKIARDMGRPDGLTVADVGTGSGAIAIAVASELAGVRVVAGDISHEALAVAQHNAQLNDQSGRIQFVGGDGLLPLVRANEGAPFDLVLSNPPYITDGEFPDVMREVREWEPRQALTAGAEGLDVIVPLVRAAAGGALKPGGAILLEIGSRNQADRVAEFLETSKFEGVRIQDDYAGKARVVVGYAGKE